MSKYRLIKQIGKGGAGIVYLAWHTGLEKYVVMKEMIAGRTCLEQMRHETDILKNLHHAGLPQVYDFLEVQGKFYMVEEFIEGECLENMIRRGKRISEEQIIIWLRQFCQVLEYLHTRPQKIIHSDIKPGNVIITRENNVCLIDFNISVVAQNTGIKLKGCSGYYASPEQIAIFNRIREGANVRHMNLTPASDIYSMCATFYTVMTGAYPPYNVNQRHADINRFPYSTALWAVIDHGIQTDPAKRFQSAAEVEKALRHPEKLTPAFRHYIRLRTLVSMLGILLCAGGILLIYYGMTRNIYAEYRELRNEIEYICVAEGINAEAAQKAEGLLENGKYAVILRNRKEEKAQLYSVLGSYYYQLETVSGYENAAYYDEQALRFGAGSSEEVLYRENYAAALYQSGRYKESLDVLESTEAGGNLQKYLKAYYQALCYQALGQWDSARSCCREAMKIYENMGENERPQINKDDLQKLEKILGGTD